jgi:VanZ family protein
MPTLPTGEGHESFLRALLRIVPRPQRIPRENPQPGWPCLEAPPKTSKNALQPGCILYPRLIAGICRLKKAPAVPGLKTAFTRAIRGARGIFPAVPRANLFRFLESSRFWFALTCLWAGIVFVLSSLEAVAISTIDVGPFEIDRVLHTMMFIVGGLFLTTALHLRSPETSWKRTLTLSVALLILYGITDEFHQSFVKNRSGNDLGDLLADTIGAVLGAIITRITYGKHRASESEGS